MRPAFNRRQGDVWVYSLDDGTSVLTVDNATSQTVQDIDGTFVVYGDNRNVPGLDIYALNLTDLTENPVVVAPGNQTEPAISGNRVVWESTDPNSSNVDIVVGCVAGCTNTQLTTDPSVQFHPAISGDLVVWEDTRSGGGNGDIFAYWFSTPPTAFGVPGENAIAVGSPLARFPDVSGTRVVWEQEATGADTKDIYLYDFATGLTTQITTDPADQSRPRISGNLIVWQDERNAAGNSTDIYGFDLVTNTEMALVTGALKEHLADVDVRPVGGWDLAYTVDQGSGNSDIFVLRAIITGETTHTLSVSLAGTGSGTVASEPPGIDCGGDCSEEFSEGTVVTLTATPDSGSEFAGWSGSCSGTGTCIVTMDAAKSATATFELLDTDGDGIPDISDNCPTTPNATQTDTDADGVGPATTLSPAGSATTPSQERPAATPSSGE